MPELLYSEDHGWSVYDTETKTLYGDFLSFSDALEFHKICIEETE